MSTMRQIPLPIDAGTPDRGPAILMRSGVLWYPDAPDAADVRWHDFRNLTLMPRWSGSAGEDIGYSVAEHCIRTARVLASWGCPLDVQLQGLVHDLHEIYPPFDVPGPLLRSGKMAEFLREQEGAARDALRSALGLPLRFDSMVHQADMVMLATERRDLMPDAHGDRFRNLPEPLAYHLKPNGWHAGFAWDMWCSAYYELNGKLPRTDGSFPL